MKDNQKQHWQTLCSSYIEEQQLPAHFKDILKAFGSGKDNQAAPNDLSQSDMLEQFTQLKESLLSKCEALQKQIIENLEQEVDHAQALMFSRRWRDSVQLMESLQSPAQGIFQIALCSRLQEILKAPRPRALRVRALADYYYSQAAVYYHTEKQSEQATKSLQELVEKADWSKCAEGIFHTTLKGNTSEGPVHINILRLHEGQTRIECLDCRDYELRFSDLIKKKRAVAGVSGGFFLYSETDIEAPSQRTDPVGLLIEQGFIKQAPTFRRAAILQNKEQIFLETVGMTGLRITTENDERVIFSENSLENLGKQVVSYNRAWGYDSPEYEGISISFVGYRVLKIRQGSQQIPLSGFVLTLPKGHTCNMHEGQEVNFKLATHIQEAMAGGPTLLSKGIKKIQLESEDFAKTAPPVTFSQDETFDQNRLPRMAVGKATNGDLYFAAIDGRNFEKAPGFTLSQTADLMLVLGCSDAINLDGGSSKRMLIGEKTVDLPSTEIRKESSQNLQQIRPVHSGILIFSKSK